MFYAYLIVNIHLLCNCVLMQNERYLSVKVSLIDKMPENG